MPTLVRMSDDGERERTGWNRLAKALSVTLIVVGLVGLGAIVLFVAAMNSWANNK